MHTLRGSTSGSQKPLVIFLIIIMSKNGETLIISVGPEIASLYIEKLQPKAKKHRLCTCCWC